MGRVIRSTSLALVALVAAASGAAAQAPLSGAYSTTLEAQDVRNLKGVPTDQFLGTWTLSFNPDGTYTVQQNGVEHVKGTFSLAGEVLTLLDRSGDYACMDGDAPAAGEYRLGRDSKTITLVKVKDPLCPGRAAALTLKPYTAAR